MVPGGATSMAQDLDIRHFFRRSPRDWLRRYFAWREVFSHIDWASISVRNIEPLMEAWGSLEADLQARLVEDFSNIKLLATPVGKVQIIDEATHHGKELEVSAKLTELEDFYDCAFWVFFEQPVCWNGAVFYAVADSKPKRYWRRRINLPRLGRSPTPADGKALAAAIADVFRNKEGRGDHCVVHQYRRGAREYYFAYPQDHRQTAIEYHNGEMTKRPHAPAFEIVFIHDDEQQTLNTWHQGKKDRVNDLQVAFARAVLGREIERQSPRDDRAYDLDGFLDAEFSFQPRPELGISRVDVRRIGVRVFGPEPCTIHIEVGDKTPTHVLQQRLKAATYGIGSSMLKVARIGMRVTFEKGADDGRPKTRTFDIVWPNSCSLQNDSYGILIQHMLADHGIEPRRRKADEPNGGNGR